MKRKERSISTNLALFLVTSINGNQLSNLLIAIEAVSSNKPNLAKVKPPFFSHFPHLIFTDMYDKDHTGTIDINEFQALFNNINQWKAVFESYDKDRSGRIDQNELDQG